MLAAAAAALALALKACPVERASYVLRGDPRYAAWFRKVETGPDWPFDVAFAVRSAVTGRTFWWLPGVPGSSGVREFFSTTDVEAPGWTAPSADGGPRPLGAVAYLTADATDKILDVAPRAGAAPAHILIPTLGEAI